MSDTRFRATIIHASPVLVRVRFASLSRENGTWATNGILGFSPQEWRAVRPMLEASGFEVVGSDEGVEK